MTDRILKYTLEFKLKQIIKLPIEKQASLLYFGLQNGKPTVWMGVKEYCIPGDTEILMIPTGGYIPHNGLYLGTAIDNNDEVWHFWSPE